MKKIMTGFFITVLMLSLFSTNVLAQNESDTWSMYRPSQYTDIDERVQNATTDEEASVGIGVHIVEYFENTERDPYWGRDGVTLRVAATANTRKGITYSSTVYDGLFDWVSALTPTGITGDDDGVWIDLPFPVRFYGGPGAQSSSAEYSRVWVCSNGFLSFDSELTSPYSVLIPDPSLPNTMIAAHWADLDPSGGSIKYYADSTIFVVLWDNVLNKHNGYRQTFEVIIEDFMTPSGARGQNRIQLLYESVEWSGSNAIAGIEDQEGFKGTTLSPYPTGNQGVMFTATQEAPEIREITIKLQKSDSDAEIYPTVNYFSLKGYNVEYISPEPDTDGFFENALWGYGTLLVTTFVGDPAAGVILGATLVTVELAPDFARALYPAHELDYKHAGQSDEFAYVNASAAYSGSWGWPVDAMLGDQFEWVFTDENNDRNHSVTITAELEYYSYDQNKIITISTSVDLDVLIQQYELSITASNGGTTNPVPGTYTYTSGSSVTVTAIASSDYSFNYWLLDGETVYSNPITVTMNSNHTLNAYFIYDGPPGDIYTGCPYVSTWNGTHYIIDNNLLPTSEANSDIDVEDYYILQQTLASSNNIYKLMISEFEQEHSYFDKFNLIAVNHESDVNIAVTPSGEVLTFKDPSSPASAVDNNGNDVLSLLQEVDENYYEGHAGDYLLLDFGNLNTENGAKLVFRADPPEAGKWSIYVQVRNTSMLWETAAIIVPRIYWSTEIVDLSSWLPDPNGDLKVRLVFTNIHRVDYVGLDTTPQADYTLSQGYLLWAIHSEQGFVGWKLRFEDQIYTELLPGQTIRLTFYLLPQDKPETQRTFILYSKGRYFTIP